MHLSVTCLFVMNGLLVQPGFKKAKDPVQEAAALRIAEQYVAAFGQIAKEGNTVLLPAALSDPAAIVGQALGIYKGITGVGGTPAG